MRCRQRVQKKVNWGDGIADALIFFPLNYRIYMIWLILKVVKMGVNFSEQVNISKLSTFMITALHLILSYGKKTCKLFSIFSSKWGYINISYSKIVKNCTHSKKFKNWKLISSKFSSFLELKVVFRLSKHCVASKPWINGSSEYLKWSLNVF